MDELFAPPNNFLGLYPEDTDYDKVKYVILPIPYDATTSYMPGTRFGPEAIIAASRMVELYDEELGFETYKEGIGTSLPVLISTEGPETTMRRIKEAAAQIISSGKFVVGIGGEHSITYPLVAALNKTKKDNFGVLQFDAHSDFREEYEGSIFSHACVMRRISEMKIPVYQVGIRSISAEEIPSLKKEKVQTYMMKDIADKSAEIIATELVKNLPKNIYITIDLDVLDPSIMPSTGTPEPGGMTWYQILKILRPVILSKNVVGMDFNELSPIPGFVAPNFLAAKLIYRLLGYVAKSRISR